MRKASSIRCSSTTWSAFLLALSLLAFSASLVVLLLSRASHLEAKSRSGNDLGITLAEEFYYRERYKTFRLSLANVTSPLNFVVLDSPQSKALQWLVEQDTTIDTTDLSRLEQRYAMMVLYYNNGGTRWNLDLPFSDLTDTNECNFQGVFCEGGVITRLAWSELGILGTLPKEFSLLSSLESINLGTNEISGTISDFFFKLPNLKALDLSRNRLSSTISPDIGQILELEQLALFANDLSGTLPTSLTLLSNIRYLNINANNKLSGPILDRVLSMRHLEVLDFSYTNISGTIPSTIGQLSALRVLQTLGSKLEGEFPASEFAKLENLEVLILAATNFTDSTIPSEILQLTQLSSLVFDGPSWIGTIPSEIANLSNLDSLRISGTSMTGNLPQELAQLTNLEILFLQRNEFSGTIPDIFTNMTNLGLIDIVGNKFTGSIPASACNTRLAYDCFISCDPQCCLQPCQT